MRLKTNNGLYRYDINRTKLRNGDKYTKYKLCLSIIMVMWNKKHLGNF